MNDYKLKLCHFDGTVYNKSELREKMSGRGVRCSNETDAEILLNAYRCWGENCADYLEGMFAFVIWDGAQFFMARDPMGVKPLFYFTGADGLGFASNLKRLRAPAVIDKESIFELLLLGPGRTPGSGIFSGVKALLPGQCAVYARESGLRARTYFKFTAEPFPHSFEEAAETVKGLLTDSIKKQSAGNTASFLSGGLDSSSIAAISGVHETFSVDYADNDLYFTPDAFQPEGDDVYIKRMTDFLDARHTKIMIGAEELAAALGDAVTARGLPGMADVDASLLIFCRRVKEKLNAGASPSAVLSGECADELFGGYPWYRDETRLWEDAFPWSRSGLYRARFIRPEIASETECAEFVRSRYEDAVAAADFLPNDSPLEKRMRQMFTLNVGWFGQTLLERHNSMSVFAGLEARVPFCDRRLAAYAFNIPWEYKNYKGREKGLLREALRGVLPEAVLWRKKSPYPKTHNPFYLKIISGMINDVLADPNAPLFDVCDRNAVRNLLTASDGADRWYGQLMTRPQTLAYFWQINEWMKRFAVGIRL